MTMHRSMIWLLASCAWGVCLWWALLLQKLPTSAFGEHTVCGAWGCGPPLPVLLACHVFWMVLLTPPAFVTALRLPAHRVRFFGTLLVVLGLSGLAAVGVWEAATWLREASEWQRRFSDPGNLDRGSGSLAGGRPRLVASSDRRVNN
jgi:hypothetical protein